MSRDRDDDFSFDDDLFGDNDDSLGDDDFSFDDGFGDANFDTDFDNDLDDFDDNEDFFADEEAVGQERSGPSRTFIFLAGIMIVLLLAGLGLILFLALQDTGPSDRDLTATSIVAFNFTQEAFLEETQTQEAENAIATETQVAIDNQATETAVVVQATETAEAIVIQTQDAENAFATQTAEADAEIAQQTQDAANAIATQTAQAGVTEVAAQPTTEEPAEETVEPVDPGGVALTATALFEFLNTPIATVGPGAGGPVDGQPTTPPSELPTTGLLDGDASAGGVGVMMLMAFGLIGIIFGARRLRSMNQ